MIIDHISDLIAKIKNATRARLPYVRVTSTSLVNNVLKILKEEGYILDFEIKNANSRKTRDKEKSNKKYTLVKLKYKNQVPAINGIKQISKSSLRIYTNCEKMPNVLNGLGIAIISTSHGLLTNKQAKKANLGGEVIAYIW